MIENLTEDLSKYSFSGTSKTTEFESMGLKQAKLVITDAEEACDDVICEGYNLWLTIDALTSRVKEK